MAPSPDSDTELGRRLLAGDMTAFDRFVDLYRPKIYNYSFVMCGQPDDAEEVAQDTLMQVFTHLGQLREPDRLKAWVFRIAKNACLTKRRKSVFAPVHELSLDELMPTRDGETHRIEIADWRALPEDEALRVELKKELDGSIRRLPEIYRPILLLRDVEGLSTEDTAEILDLSEDVVKTRLHRARLAVRKDLDQYLRAQEKSHG
ncbi:MAG: sigma-70 family RNA polymerase sigma factor [Bryobacteraceae bacterium]